jgi:putative transposase
MTGPNPTDRGKLGTKRHVLTDGQGIPLSVVVITAANTNDMTAAISVLDNIVAKRPSSKINKKRQNLYLDKGYDF